MNGPAVVAVGGGHGLAASLGAARRYAGSITAVVSVADDGGSSGRLRAIRPGLPAPGDVRRCLSALAGEQSALARTLEHRFEDANGELHGHAFGNLLLATLTDELGSFEAAVYEVARLIDAVGQVLPATSGPVALVGRLSPTASAASGTETGAGARVVGQVAVQNALGVSGLSLSPAHPPSPRAVIDAIMAADQVVIGPGSLFTSVLAAAIVPAVSEALAGTRAQRIYVANLAPQVPETAGFTLADHLTVLAAHHVPVDVVLCHEAIATDPLPGGVADLDRPTPLVVAGPLADDRGLAHHPVRLAAALASLL